MFSFLGSLQRTVGQLWAHGLDLGRPGFLYGLFDQGKTLGLIGHKESNPGRHLQMKKPPNANNKIENIIKINKLIRTVLKAAQHTRVQMFLNILFLLQKILSRLPLSASLHFLFSKSKNFIFLLGLHIRIFHSLAFAF